jgi:hypothetical protein
VLVGGGMQIRGATLVAEFLPAKLLLSLHYRLQYTAARGVEIGMRDFIGTPVTL